MDSENFFSRAMAMRLARSTDDFECELALALDDWRGDARPREIDRFVAALSLVGLRLVPLKGPRGLSTSLHGRAWWCDHPTLGLTLVGLRNDEWTAYDSVEALGRGHLVVAAGDDPEGLPGVAELFSICVAGWWVVVVFDPTGHQEPRIFRRRRGGVVTERWATLAGAAGAAHDYANRSGAPHWGGQPPAERLVCLQSRREGGSKGRWVSEGVDEMTRGARPSALWAG